MILINMSIKKDNAVQYSFQTTAHIGGINKQKKISMSTTGTERMKVTKKEKAQKSDGDRQICTET